MQRFSYLEVVETAFRTARGHRLEQARATGLARQFGDTLPGLHKPCGTLSMISARTACQLQRYQPDAESHALGSVLVAAVFEPSSLCSGAKATRYVRLATNGTGRLPAGRSPSITNVSWPEEASQLSIVLTICIAPSTTVHRSTCNWANSACPHHR